MISRFNYENSKKCHICEETFKKDDKIQAPNLGGNRVLPCSEEYFNMITGSRHVPDPYINASCYTVSYLKNGVILTSPISKILGIQIKRTITISETGTDVKIEQELFKKTLAKNSDLEKIPLTIWSLSKIKTPNISFLPIHKKSIFNDGYLIPIWPDAKNFAEINVSVYFKTTFLFVCCLLNWHTIFIQ